MPAIDKCPDPARWSDLLDSRLPKPMADALCSHLDGCPGCQSTLDRLTAGEASWAEAARVLDERPRPALRRAIEQLKAETEVGLDTAGPSTTATLPFLRPSAEAGHLGRLGSYDVLGVIGRGGMGVVVKAFDPALRRLVAIKVLAPQWASHPQARQRFEREARAAARVRHDNVVAIHAVEEADGLPYLVMEYVPGLSVQQQLDRDGPFAVEEVLHIGAQAAAGLAAAHKQGLIHRDVKPANILLDSAGNVRLTDFGLARAVDDTSLTQSGTIAGTPQYMAPEQARGAALDHRADLFSLGSVLYAMCTGRPPFRASTTVAVLKRVCDEEAPDVRDFNPDVPGWLVQIIDRLHAKRPRDRFQSAAEVARLLNRHLAHLRSPDTVPIPEPVRRPRRATSPWVWAAVLVVPGAVAASVLIWGAIRLFSPRPEFDGSETKGDGPQVQVPRGEPSRGPLPKNEPPPVPVPRVEGDAFFQEVWADLHSREQHRRKAALERLANLKPNASRAVVAQELIELTKVEDVWIRQGAVKALGAWGSKDEVPALQRAMAHNDVFTRKEALKVVGRFRDERTLEGVIVGFRDPMTRAEAGQALRDMGPMAEASVLALIKSLPRDEWMLKKPAIEVLADIGTEKSVPVLTDVATNGHRFAAEPAQKALAAIAKREKQ